MVAHTCNPCYQGSGNRRITFPSPQVKVRAYLKNKPQAYRQGMPATPATSKVEIGASQFKAS
jgi:hypothetical protein